MDTLQDSVGVEWSVHTPEILARVDELVDRGEEPARIATALAEMAHRALVAGRLPEFWASWEASGIDVVSVTGP